MEPSAFDEPAFFRAIHHSHARALLIGRRALVARSVSIVDGQRIEFDDVWSRRRPIDFGAGIEVMVPTIDDLILTKRVRTRPKDLEDIRLSALREERAE